MSQKASCAPFRSTRDVQWSHRSYGALRRVAETPIVPGDPHGAGSRVESRTRPTNFRLARRIFECIRSRSFFRRFRCGFGVSSRSADLRNILPIISHNNVPGNSRKLHMCICIRIHCQNRLRRIQNIREYRCGAVRAGQWWPMNAFTYVYLLSLSRSKRRANYGKIISFSSFFFASRHREEAWRGRNNL